jgi:hypothetical protein
MIGLQVGLRNKMQNNTLQGGTMNTELFADVFRTPSASIATDSIRIHFYKSAAIIIYRKSEEQHELFVYKYDEKESLGLVFGEKDVISVDIVHENGALYVLILWKNNRLETRYQHTES